VQLSEVQRVGQDFSQGVL